MSMYLGQGRSNYFNVIDEEAFTLWCDEWACCKIYNDDGRMGFFCRGDDGFPYNDDMEEGYDFDASLQAVIAPEAVVIFFQSGWQKHIYGSFSLLRLTKETSEWTALQDLYDAMPGEINLPEN